MQAPPRRRRRRGERSAAGRRLRERVPERSPPDPLDGRRLVGLGRLCGCFRRGLRGGLRLCRLLRACWFFHGAQFTVSVTCRSNERGSPSVSRSPSAPREVPRWQPPAPPPLRPPPPRLRWYERPSVWWRRHAWIPVWIAIVLTPAALLSLRLIDDTGFALVLTPLLIGMIVLFLAMLAVAVRASATHSVPRALAGG